MCDRQFWETGFYPVRVLGGIVLAQCPEILSSTVLLRVRHLFSRHPRVAGSRGIDSGLIQSI